MTSERNFDRLARAWLEAGPDAAPSHAVEAVLRAAATTPQARRSGLRLPLRRAGMSRVALVSAAAALVVVIGGGILMSRGTGPGVSRPTPTASQAQSPLPSSLIGYWIGGPRALPALGGTAGSLLTFADSSVQFLAYGNQSGEPQLISQATGTSPGSFRLADTATCPGGDVGDYAWQLSESGRHLAITMTADKCAARATMVQGEWWKVACKDPFGADCLGDLDAGTYQTHNTATHHKPADPWAPIFGAITYTVPGGWANSADWFTSFWLTPSVNYAQETPSGPAGGAWSGIAIWTAGVLTDPPVGCSTAPRGTAPTVDHILQQLATSQSLTASAPEDITIDGHHGRWIDVEIAATWTGSCPGGNPPPATPDAGFVPNTGPWAFGPIPGERTRLIALDLGNDDVVVIGIDSGDGSKFAALLVQAMPIVQSLVFK